MDCYCHWESLNIYKKIKIKILSLYNRSVTTLKSYFLLFFLIISFQLFSQEDKQAFVPKINLHGGVSFQEAIHLGVSVGDQTQWGISAGYIPGLERRVAATSIKHRFYQFGPDQYHIKNVYGRLNAGLAFEITQSVPFYALVGGIEFPFQSVHRFNVGIETGILYITDRGVIPAFGVRINYRSYDLDNK